MAQGARGCDEMYKIPIIKDPATRVNNYTSAQLP